MFSLVNVGKKLRNKSRKSDHTTSGFRKAVVTLFASGFTITQTASFLRMKRTTVSSMITIWRSEGRDHTKTPGGRKLALSPRDRRRLKFLICSDRMATQARVFSQFNRYLDKPLSDRTLKRYCKRLKVKRRPRSKRQVLKARHRIGRQAWCRERKYWKVAEHWSRVLFSDECKVKLGDDRKVEVWKFDGEGSNRPELYGDPIEGQKKVEVMFWGCITSKGVGTLHFFEGNANALKYIDLLEAQLWPVIIKHFPDGNYIFQDDGASVHTAKIVQRWKTIHGVHTMPWPALSPDLNIIENVWAILKHGLQRRADHINTVEELKTHITAIWDRVSPLYIKNLYSSMPRRVHAVLKRKGHFTKY